MNIIKQIVTFCALTACIEALSQEMLIPLSENVLLRELSQQKNSKLKSGSETQQQYTHLIDLPFYDDFARPQNLPDKSLWSDQMVFINNSWGIAPPTIGVASLDAMDGKGRLYKNASSASFDADTLTSLPINLQTYTIKTPSNALYIKNGDALINISDSMYYKIRNKYFQLSTDLYLYEAKDTIYQKRENTYKALNETIYRETKDSIPGSKKHINQFIKYKQQDSLNLSFYYQAGGYALSPTKDKDSIMLDVYQPSKTANGILINEITNNWIELYNATETQVDISNYYLVAPDTTVDKIKNKYNIESYKISNLETSSTTISPYGYILVYTNKFSNFPKRRKFVSLYDINQNKTDSIPIDKTDSIQSAFARIPDGGATDYSTPSPLAPNGNWKLVWSSKSGSVNSFTYVNIPLDSSSLTKGFRFRFRNLASLSNDASFAYNADVWNIDNVYLCSNYSQKKANYSDIGFRSGQINFINEYTSIPLHHIDSINAGNLQTYLPCETQNFDRNKRRISYSFMIKKVNSQSSNDLLAADIKSREANPWSGVNTGNDLDTLNLNDTYLNSDLIYDYIRANYSKNSTAAFDIKYYITDNNTPIHSAFRWNDTIRARQYFYNFYAYDDGTPELGYGTIGAVNTQFACSFKTYKKDVLTAVQFYFNPTLYSSPKNFFVCIWKKGKNKAPDSLIYKKSEVVKYDSSLYHYITYPIDTSGIIDKTKKELTIDGDFFVGIQQYSDKIMLSLGADINNKALRKMYYNVDNEGWQLSIYSHAPMIRPLFGEDIPLQNKNIEPTTDISIYPNPTHDKCSISRHETWINEAKYWITDISGAIIIESINPTSISLSNVPDGLYFITIELLNGATITQKIIKN